MGWIKTLLDKLPFNGLKTFLGFLVVLLTEVAQTTTDTDNIAIINAIIEILKEYGAVTLPAGIVLFIAGAYHKVLKIIEKKNKPVAAEPTDSDTIKLV